LLLFPRPVLESAAHLRVDSHSAAIARVLGARHLTQAVLSGITPSPEVLALGIWTDAVHAVTAVGLAVSDRSRVRAGLTDAIVAGVWAALGYRALGGAASHRPGHDRRRDQLARQVLRIAPGGRTLLRRADMRDECR
jgi:hypothetical protein